MEFEKMKKFHGYVKYMLYFKKWEKTDKELHARVLKNFETSMKKYDSKNIKDRLLMSECKDTLFELKSKVLGESLYKF